MSKLKKRKGYIIVNDDIVVECEILKETTEDRIKNMKNKSVYRKPKYKVVDTFTSEPLKKESEEFFRHVSTYPAKMLFVSYTNKLGKPVEKWTYADLVKDNAVDFVEFIPMPWEKSC